jgi:hypothetical protein
VGRVAGFAAAAVAAAVVVSAASGRPPHPSIPTVAPPWEGAGAFVWHEDAVDPVRLAQTLRAAGFSWAAIRLHEGVDVDPVQPGWIERYRAAGGPPLGGWGVLRQSPRKEAGIAVALLRRLHLGFYVANAEEEYKYTNLDGTSAERWNRSLEFARSFREFTGAVPAAVSSYCRADQQDLDWKAWADRDFAFLPQAYVNQHGMPTAPRECVRGARASFPLDRVHPTIGTYQSTIPVPMDAYVRLLAAAARAGSRGFSVYLAETNVSDADWAMLAVAVAGGQIAAPSGA